MIFLVTGSQTSPNFGTEEVCLPELSLVLENKFGWGKDDLKCPVDARKNAGD